ncbi:MAG: transposase [Planctomycetaceae bacterium]|nr:transposase [Planctomycetaceae bacterium]
MSIENLENRGGSSPEHAQGTLSAGTVEGFNNKAKLTMRKPYGFRTEQALEVALYHNLAKLPEPNHPHAFW